MAKTYVFYCDPGHAWLKVTRQELFSLGIADKISGCSYQNGNNVFLEEDCDALIFLNAKRDYKITEKFTDNQSKIRGYDYFESGLVL